VATGFTSRRPYGYHNPSHNAIAWKAQNEPGSVPGKENLVIKTYRWLDERLGIEGVVRATALHPVPRTVNWWYVFGSAALTAFMIQVITGTFLAFSYIPSPDHAFQSLDYITHHQLLGNVLRGIHYWEPPPWC
jgi:ubiquinol-cytochrome c reductase cytochrome b subunit